MATTKKTGTTTKKAVPRKKKVNTAERMKYVDKIFKLRDSVYKKFMADGRIHTVKTNSKKR